MRLPRPTLARALALAALGACVTGAAGCRYYEVTRADGTVERISRAEYEDLQRTSRRLGNVPSTRVQREVEPFDPADAGGRD